MLKIFNGRNFDLLELLCYYNFPLTHRLYKAINPEEYDLLQAQLEADYHVQTDVPEMFASITEHLKVLGIAFARSFQPFPDLLNGFLKTFRPYKSGKYVLYDLAQPLRGIGNIVYGLLTVISSPFFILFNIAHISINLILNAINKRPNPPAKNIAAFYIETIFYPVFLALQGLLTAAQGVIQLITTPLLIPKMMMRGLISCCVDPTNIENSRGVKRLLTKAASEYVFTGTNENGEKTRYVSDSYEDIKAELINKQLKYKYKKAEKQWRDVPQLPEPQAESGQIDYISFFRKFNPDIKPKETPAYDVRIERPSSPAAR